MLSPSTKSLLDGSKVRKIQEVISVRSLIQLSPTSLLSSFFAAARALKSKDSDEAEEAAAQTAALEVEMQTKTIECGNGNNGYGNGDGNAKGYANGCSSAVADNNSAGRDSENTSLPASTHAVAEQQPSYSTFTKVLVCVVSGILCTMLQFAFVFSKDMRTIAENDYGVAAAKTSAVTFFFAITICPFPNIVIPLFLLLRAKLLRKMLAGKETMSNVFKAFLFMALPWVAQSYMYGISASVLLGDSLGPAVGWPLLIVTTNVTGLILGWRLLGEWESAKKKTILLIKISLLLSVVGLAIVSAGGFVV